MQETPAQAEIIYGISNIQGSDHIFSFDSSSPGPLLSFQPVTGFVDIDDSNEGIAGGIDIRPANGKLYGVSRRGRIYTVDPLTGIATLASTFHSAQEPDPGFLLANVGGIDFDPVWPENT